MRVALRPCPAARRTPDASRGRRTWRRSSSRHQASRRRLSARVADLVAQIVGPAAEGVDVVEILVQALGQQEADHVEIFVVMRGQPARVALGFGNGVDARPAPRERGRSPWGRETREAYGMIAVFRWPLWLIRCRITSSRLASGSSRFTKSLRGDVAVG